MLDHRRSLAKVLLTSAVAAVGAPAEGQRAKVLPQSATNSDANDLSYYPFGLDAARLQEVIAGSAITNGAALLTGFAVRAEGAVSGTRQYSRRVVPRLDVELGHSSVTPATMSKVFASNRKGSLTKLFSASYTLPAMNVRGVAPWNLIVKFTRPFLYTRQSGDLVVEMVLPGSATTLYSWALDAYRGAGKGRARSFGLAGPFAGRDSYQFVGSAAYLLHPGGRATLGVSDLNQQYPAVAAFGFSNTFYGSLRLPFDLTPLGAAANSLYVSLELVLPLPLQLDKGKWHGTASFAIPRVPIATGTRLFGQGVFADPRSNGLGLVFSGGVELILDTQPGAPFNAVGSVSSTSADGVFFIGLEPGGPVIQLHGSGFN